MFESWTTGEKVAGVVVAAGIAVVLYQTFKPSKLATGPAQPSPLPGPTPSPAPASTPVAQPASGPSTAPSYTVTTKASDLNVRSQPSSTNSPVIATIKQGQTVQGTGPVVLGPGSTTGWLPILIILPNGQTSPGYVSMDFLTPVASGQSSVISASTTAPQQPLGNYPLYKVQTSGGQPAPVYDGADGKSQNGTMDNGTLVYGTGTTQGNFTQLLDPTSANLIIGWVQSTMLVLQPPAVNV